jgi:hypothetical protein
MRQGFTKTLALLADLRGTVSELRAAAAATRIDAAVQDKLWQDTKEAMLAAVRAELDRSTDADA